MEAKNKHMYYKIKGFENYAIGFDGSVINIKTGRKLKQKLNKNGYYSVTFSINGKLYFRYIHRLVCETFVKNTKNSKQVNHKDGNKENNNIENLEWCTSKENIKHAWENGLSKVSDKLRISAANNCKKRTKKIIDTTSGTIYCSIYELSLILNIKPKTLYARLNGQNKNNTNYRYA